MTLNSGNFSEAQRRDSSGLENFRESDYLLESSPSSGREEWRYVQIPSNGLRHYSGISSSYSTQYPPLLNYIISQEEFTEIVERLNETIRDYWPCTTCYLFGYGCALCSLGLTICIPHYCATHSEKYATAYLRNVSLKSKYYDRQISFILVKKFCHSYVEIRLPASLFGSSSSDDSVVKNNVTTVQPLGSKDLEAAGEISPISNAFLSMLAHNRSKKL